MILISVHVHALTSHCTILLIDVQALPFAIDGHTSVMDARINLSFSWLTSDVRCVCVPISDS